MHILVATDGSKQSLAAARQLKALADPAKITDITVVAVVSPMAAVPFANELSGPRKGGEPTELSFRDEAQSAIGIVAAEFDGWVPKVNRKLRSGSPAAEIVKVATQLPADLIVIASGSRGLSDTILLGSTAQRVPHSAPCPVLVSRPTPRASSGRSRSTR